DELVRRIDGRLALAGPVVGVNEIEPGLARLVRERVARRERLEGLDGGVEVVRLERALGLLVQRLRALAGEARLSVRAAAGEQAGDGNEEDAQGCEGAPRATEPGHSGSGLSFVTIRVGSISSTVTFALGGPLEEDWPAFETPENGGEV